LVLSAGWDLLHAKFEVSIFTYDEDMKGNAKCRNCGGLGG